MFLEFKQKWDTGLSTDFSQIWDLRSSGLLNNK